MIGVQRRFQHYFSYTAIVSESIHAFTSTPNNVLFKPLATFLHNHRQHGGQRWDPVATSIPNHRIKNGHRIGDRTGEHDFLILYYGTDSATGARRFII